MRAIRVAKRGKTGGHTWHWLVDAGRTYCGRDPGELDVVDGLERDTLPAVEACRACQRAVDAGSGIWQKPVRETADRQIASPAPGRLRTTGSLSHGFGPRSGRRLS